MTLILFLSALHLKAAASIPVFRHPSSPLQSGTQQRSWLEKKTQEVRTQKWIETEVEGQKGWLPTAHVWQNTDLGSQILIPKQTPLRLAPVLSQNPVRTTDKEDLTTVLLRRDGWLQVQLQKRLYWVEAEQVQVQPSSLDDAIVRKNTHLRRDIPAVVQDKVISVGELVAGERVRVLATLDSWIRVETPTKKVGYVPSTELWRASPQQAMVRTPGSELRAQPTYQSRPIKRVAAGMEMPILKAKAVRWGFAKLGSAEEIWWDIDELNKPSKLPVLKKTSQLFRDPIFDMASSPSIPNLTFLSANGVYRTLDGENWEKLEDFAEQDHPVAVSSNGNIFIGDTRSRDNGQKFEGYIQWDQLVAAIRAHEPVALNTIRLVKIEFPEGSDHIVQLTLLTSGRELIVQGSNQGNYRWRFESSRKL